METLSLFQELENPAVALKAAIKADVEAAGGYKEVAKVLWPAQAGKDLIKASQRLMNACNPNQKQELDYYEIQTVKQLARKASGASHIHVHESIPLDVDLKWISKQEKAERSAIKLIDAARAVERAVLAAQEVLREIK